jgi:hypothetical protein
MDASKNNLNLNHQTGDFEPVYIKQEEGIIPSSAFAIMKSEDKVKLIFLLQYHFLQFFFQDVCTVCLVAFLNCNVAEQCQ